MYQQTIFQQSWQPWLTQNWESLARGNEVQFEVPYSLPHPRNAGFERLDIAEPHGQVEDWAMPLTDGSRLHVHIMPDGTLHAHRDRHNPKIGLLGAAKHFFVETALGKAVLTVTVIIGLPLLLAGGIASLSKAKS